MSGIVVDSSGGVIPGADVKVKNNGTGAEATAVSGSDGGFTIPSLHRRHLLGDGLADGLQDRGAQLGVALNAAVPATVRVVLEVGALEENVTVVGDSATVVQTQSPSISTNITGTADHEPAADQPQRARFAHVAAGFNTSGTARNSTVSGLPRSAINITLDGMSVQDNYLKTTDGYFARLSPLLDSVEEVTVTTAGNTADATGQGAVQIKFVTKSGTNSWTGTAYEYLRHDALNANTWFRNRDLPPDPGDRQGAEGQAATATSQGVAQGGPILRNKAFFFFNYEEQRAPSSEHAAARHPDARGVAPGVFSYNVGGSVAAGEPAAARGGERPARDRSIRWWRSCSPTSRRRRKQSGSVLAAVESAGAAVHLVDADEELQSVADVPPRLRADAEASADRVVQLSPHQLDAGHDQQRAAAVPGIRDHGQPAVDAVDDVGVAAVDVPANLVNEFRVGGTGGATLFSPELETVDVERRGGRQSGGFRFNFERPPAAAPDSQLTNPGLGNGQSSREASTKVIEDTATWIKGKHNVTFGGSMVQADVWLQNQTLVPTVNFGLIASESANAMFTRRTSRARQRPISRTRRACTRCSPVASRRFTGDARINPAGDAYVPLGLSRAEGRMREFDFFAADSWRVDAEPDRQRRRALRPGELPFYPINNSYTTVTEASLYGISGVGNLFKPGTLTGTKPSLRSVSRRAPTPTTPDRNNLAPSVGVAWQLPGHDRAASAGCCFGSEEGDSVIRGGGAMAFQRPGMSDFTGAFGANQGIQVDSRIATMRTATSDRCRCCCGTPAR